MEKGGFAEIVAEKNFKVMGLACDPGEFDPDIHGSIGASAKSRRAIALIARGNVGLFGCASMTKSVSTKSFRSDGDRRSMSSGSGMAIANLTRAALGIL
jgi:hypothetical protein